MMADYKRAATEWDVIRRVEGRFKLPDCLLFAVGSRETNLTNVVGDFGHGHGVFQLDDRSHPIPAGFDEDVTLQAMTAGAMLAGLRADFDGELAPAVAAYNAGAFSVRQAIGAGRHADSVTTGGDYSQDVLGRMTSFHGEHLRVRAGLPPKTP